MIFSGIRRLCLSGWLLQNRKEEYNSILKLQDFLFLYECFSKAYGKQCDFRDLMGCKTGPLFRQVCEDYIKDKKGFDFYAIHTYVSHNICNENIIDENIARKCGFIVATQTDRELSDLVCSMNIWKAKKHLIIAEEYEDIPEEQDIYLTENDFNGSDIHLINMLGKLYSNEVVENSDIINIGGCYFVLNQNDIPRLTKKYFDTLDAVAKSNQPAQNPLFVEIDKEGVLFID